MQIKAIEILAHKADIDLNHLANGNNDVELVPRNLVIFKLVKHQLKTLNGGLCGDCRGWLAIWKEEPGFGFCHLTFLFPKLIIA